MNNLEYNVTTQPCSRCGCTKPKVYIHGSYKCSECKCTSDDCCSGEVANGVLIELGKGNDH